MFSIDHLGVAVKSLAAAKAIYEKLGLRLAPEETVEAEQVRVVMVPLGESRIELLEPPRRTPSLRNLLPSVARDCTTSRCACPTWRPPSSG